MLFADSVAKLAQLPVCPFVAPVAVIVYEVHGIEDNVIMERILSRIILPLSQFHVSLVILSINNSLLKKTPHLSFS